MASGGVPWAQTPLGSVERRRALFTGHCVIKGGMRALLRAPSSYRAALSHLERFSCPTHRIAKLPCAPPRRAISMPRDPTAVDTSISLPGDITSGMRETARSNPTNRKVYINSDGEEVTETNYVEEALGIPAKEGQGFAQFSLGDAIGVKGRYKIVRKLGWGTNSSVWMAFDELDKRYVAIKSLKGYTTAPVERGVVREPQALLAVSKGQGPTPGHCIKVLSLFNQPGKGDDGSHLCIVTDVLGGNVQSLILQGKDNDQNKESIPVALIKRILLHTLRGLAHIHRCGIVHTDLKSDNIMFDCGGLSTDDLTALITTDPSRLNPPEYSWFGIVQSAVSQPLPLPSYSDAMERKYLIADFGSAQSSSVHVCDEITPVALRAPETILRGLWDEKVDIWTFGCIVFEILTRASLFTCEPYAPCGLDATSAHLWQMMSFTGESFTPEQLKASELSGIYFNEKGQLKPLPPKIRNPLSNSIRNYRTLEEEDMQAIVALMRRCLRLEPKNRPSADELLLDPWWEGAE